MVSESKLGLVIGVLLVVAVAVIYFPKTAQRDRTNSVVPSLPAATRTVEAQQASSQGGEER